MPPFDRNGFGGSQIKDWRSYPEGREKYNLYLASREWAILKVRVRERSREICERCRSNPGIQVHHQTYERKYKELLEDLVDTCAPCHEFLSGKRKRDPILDAPARMFGRTIKSVYLAGKITGTTWRDQLVTKTEGRWSEENHGMVEDMWGGEQPHRGGDQVWHTVPNAISIPDGRALAMTGPFWRPREDTGGHGTSTTYSYGPHCGGGYSTHGCDDKVNIEGCIRDAIERSDIVFAWIDSMECYGTLVEIGFAKALNKIILCSSPNDFRMDELWLAAQMADVGMHASNPKKAWDGFWNDLGGS